MDKWYQTIQVEVVLIEIEDEKDKHNQGGDQLIRWTEQYLFVASEDEGRAHPTWVDRCSLI